MLRADRVRCWSISASVGRIINFAWQLGIKGGHSMSHDAAAKAGVIAFTRSLALEVSQHNVLANTIVPRPLESEMVADLTWEWKNARMREVPLGQFGTPEEVAPTVLLLASEPGGNLFIGQTLGPNSGDVMPRSVPGRRAAASMDRRRDTRPARAASRLQLSGEEGRR